MESSSAELRLSVSRCFQTLTSTRDRDQDQTQTQDDVVEALQTLGSFLGPAHRHQEEFRRVHYSPTLRLLLGNLRAPWLHKLSRSQRTALWDPLFLKGPPEQALVVLMEEIGRKNPGPELELCVDLLEQFLLRGALSDLLWSYSQGTGPPDSPQFRETLLGRIASVPDLTSNKLKLETRDTFLPQNYYPLLSRAMIYVLEETCQALKDGSDCSLTFVAQILGKVCVQGHSGGVMAALVPRLSLGSSSDEVWRRVCQKLLELVPLRWTESVLTALVQLVSGPEALARIVGNLVVWNKKAQFVLTQKMLLLQYKHETRVLRAVLGFLASDKERRPLLVQVVRSLSGAWSSPSAVRHTSVEQQTYVSKALVLSVSLLDESELKELHSELMQCLLGGMQSHLDSSVEQIRRTAMVVGECLSSRIHRHGATLKFQFESGDDTEELLSLMRPINQQLQQQNQDSPPRPRAPSPEPLDTRPPSSDSDLDTRPRAPSPEPLDTRPPSSDSDLDTRPPAPDPDSDLDTRPPAPAPDPDSDLDTRPPAPAPDPDSDLDSDDELEPYDMSLDLKLSASSPPRFLRHCLEMLMNPEEADRVELSLTAAEDLVRNNPFATKEVSVKMTKVLLHLENHQRTERFLCLRRSTMVALTVVDPEPVTQYLTTEFYSLNYSLRQRLDILEVLSLAAQELSRPNTTTVEQTSASRSGPGVRAESRAPGPHLGVRAESWREVVDRRLQSKTRRFTQGPLGAPPAASPNRFAPVAGCFFFPLLRGYDRPEVTLDLLGTDHLVLGRLLHTLALFMHLALHAPVAANMARALLDLLWTVRFHTEQTVRRGALFAVSSVFESAPSLLDLGEQLFETRAWLTDVAEADPDVDCRSLAAHSLFVLDKALKKQLQDPQALALEPT